MKDMQAHLEKLRVQISECELIRDLSTDNDKRALFARLVDHFKILAYELEKVILKQSERPPPVDTFLGRKTQESFPMEDDR